MAKNTKSEPADAKDDGKGPDSKEFNYNVTINGETHLWQRPIITGKDIKELVKVKVDEYNVWRLVGREEKFISDTDKIDLTKPGDFIFITKEKDDKPDKKPTIYKFILNDKDYTWPDSTITGLQIKKLATTEVDKYDLWQEAPSNKEDIIIDDENKIDLSNNQIDYMFYTVPKQSTEGL